MSNFQTLVPAIQGVPGTAPRIYSAVTSDALNVITASGYLNDLDDKVKANDYFFINYLDTSTQPPGENSVFGTFIAVLNSTNMNLVASPLAVQSSSNAITAHAGGGQGSATPLTSSINRVTVVATAADSVLLPAASAGLAVTVLNAALNSANVFPTTGQQINALGANAAYALAGGAGITFYCAVAGTWNTAA